VLRSTTLVVLAVLGAACGGDETETVVTPPTSRDLFADDLASTLCQGAAPCCSELGYDQPTDDCRSSVRNAVMATIITTEDQQRELVPAEHEACITAFEAAIAAAPTCNDLPAPFEIETHCPTLFTPAPEGLGQPGDACAGVYECASPPSAGVRECVKVPSGSVCVWYLDRAAGEDCTSASSQVAVCPEGLTCTPAGSGPPICGSPPMLNAACLLGDETCVDGHVCEAGDTGDLTCQPEIGAGESCYGRPDACEKGTFCNVAFNCTPLPDPCASGECPALILQNVCR